MTNYKQYFSSPEKNPGRIFLYGSTEIFLFITTTLPHPKIDIKKCIKSKP